MKFALFKCIVLKLLLFRFLFRGLLLVQLGVHLSVFEIKASLQRSTFSCLDSFSFKTFHVGLLFFEPCEHIVSAIVGFTLEPV